MNSPAWQPELDDKAERMLELAANWSNHSPRVAQRMRLTIVMWVIRTKLANSLKRLLDIVVASVALLVTSPIFLVTAIAVRLDSPGPIYFKQTRVGKWGVTFGCLKFRSMYIDAEKRKTELMVHNEADGPIFKIRNDPRITRVGRVIRKLSIDELPQLLNVLRGEMSLVGPRPALPREVAEYEFDHLRRLDAVPGITGLQQISGRSDLDFKRWVELDIQYIAEQSFFKDIEILIKTLPAVVTGRGAY